MSAESQRQPAPAPPPGERLIEVGWVLAHPLDSERREAVDRGREGALTFLREAFPEFEWRMPVVERSAPVAGRREEPVALLDEGIGERTGRRWDFALVVTPSDLVAHYKSFALAVPSRAVGVAVLSTARLAPLPGEEGEADTAARLARRVEALVLHLFGDLNGLPHRGEPEALLYEPEGPEDLDAMRDLSAREREELRGHLRAVADLRLEERPGAAGGSELAFLARAAWIGAGDIASAVWQARPWELPLRLPRLTAAALSALAVVLITAEAWDLGMRQPPLRAAGFSAAVLLATSAFVLRRQRLLVRRGRPRLTEQGVVTNVSVTIVVLLGMATTYALLFGLTLGLAVTLFGRALVGEWATALAGPVGLRELLAMAAFTASMGLGIGALGASFEGQSYFRHITYADEET